jgi:hypothetical protein
VRSTRRKPATKPTLRNLCDQPFGPFAAVADVGNFPSLPIPLLLHYSVLLSIDLSP